MAAKKKPSDEFPPLRMTLEKGHLVPAFQFDFERLDSYKRGSKFLVWLAQDGDRPLVRAWWGTIGLYLKHTSLPFGDKETASAALKLAMGIVVPFKMPNGEWSQYPRSLTEIDDNELETALLQMRQILYGMTGVDYETLRKEAKAEKDEEFLPPAPANDIDSQLTGEDQSQSRDAPADSGGATSTPSTAASHSVAKASEDNGRISAAEGAPMPGEVSRVATGRTVAATSERMDVTDRRDGHPITDERAMVNSANSNVTFLKEEMVRKILRFVAEPDVSGNEKLELLKGIKADWAERMPGHPGLVEQVFRAARKIVLSDLTPEDGRRLMEAL